ncbi:Ig-like domain-containing protein [Sutcliffiella rhizosphaerae]|uniref:Fibronectin type-III domain-containing protein n=1 Tax=Sutcliffiella rhizosphaerae TaxID=2880967 RepID=A0ABN8AAZ9_9BACI|nr:Ig-like domain-containing protein [Sutcliffiella rhizosphaerae]CAG9620328.1 hypothetical protein BACCIP111883_01096 [Sutcliffiella rhizosphaerae]
MDIAPRLEINYTPRPAIHSALAYGLSANSKEGYVRLSWHHIQGAKGYKLSIFNGKEYETIDIGMTNEWSSLNQKLWPSPNEIKVGAYRLKLDQTGTNLPDNPSVLYNNAGGTEKDPNRYYFKIIAYNEFGDSGASEEVSVTVPNRTAPNPVQNISLTDFSQGMVSLVWDTPDTNIKEYRVRIGTTPDNANIIAEVNAHKNEISVTSSSLLQRSVIYVSINSIDKEGNYTGYSAPFPFSLGVKQDASLITSSTPERSSVTIDPAMTITMKNTGTEPWTVEKGFALKAVNGLESFEAEPLIKGEVIAPNELKTFQIKVIGKHPLGTIPLKWQMYSRESGYFGDVFTGTITFFDDVMPEVQIVSPKSSDSLYKIVDIIGTVTDYTLKEYSLDYGAGSNPKNWVLISQGTSEVNNEVLGRWDTSRLSSGIYTLKLTAIDEAGNTNSVVQEVNVNLPVPAPVVNKVTDQSINVTGAAEIGTTVYVQKGDQVLGSSLVTNSGTYSVSISKQSGGTTLKVFAQNKAGIVSEVTTVKVVDVTPPGAPTVNQVADNSTAVTGKAEKGSAVTVNKGKITIGTGTTNTDGNFSITINNQAAESVLSVIAKDAAGNSSTATTITVIDKTPPSAPKINTVGDNDTKVTGTAEKGSAVTVKRGTTTLGSAQVNSEGKYSVTIAKQKAGAIVSVTAKDAAGNVSVASTKTVVDTTPPAAPKVNEVGNNATTVKGTAEKGSTITVKAGSKTLGSRKVKTDGTYSVSIAKQKAGTTLSITAKDAAGNVSDATKRIVVDKTPPAAPSINAVYSTSTVVKGKTENGATVTVKKGSITLGSAKANSAGNYSVKISKQPKKTSLSITAKDAAGNQSKATSIVVK